MNELEEILKLKNELANKKFEYLSKTYSTMKIKYMNLIGNCYKSEWDDEYYIINDIDVEPVNEINIHIKLVGMRIYNYEKYPEIDIFNESLSLIDSNMIQISFEEFEQNLKQTLYQNIKLCTIFTYFATKTTQTHKQHSTWNV